MLRAVKDNLEHFLEDQFGELGESRWPTTVENSPTFLVVGDDLGK